MDRAARLLRGTLRVRVESAFPERVLNLCGHYPKPSFPLPNLPDTL